MAERKPLVNVSGVVNEISGSDTIPVANYPTMVGDSGSGGTKGAVPAPASGDAAAGKFLKADGTFAVPSGGTTYFTWNTSASTSISATVNNAYVLTHTALQTVTLPTTAAVGDRIKLVGVGSGKWKVAQNASEYISFGNGLATTTGTGGYLQSQEQHASIELVCVVANTGWSVVSSERLIYTDLSESINKLVKFNVSSGFEASARCLNNSGGTASATFGTSGLLAGTGTTNTSKFWLDYGIDDAFNTQFSQNWRLSFYLRRKTQGTDYDFLIGLYNGNGSIIAAAAIDYTKKHVGIKCNRTASGAETWAGTVGNGTTESTVSLTVSSPANMNVFSIEYISTSLVRFYVNNVYAGAVTTNIPALADLQSGGAACSIFATNRATTSSSVWVIPFFEFSTDAF